METDTDGLTPDDLRQRIQKEKDAELDAERIQREKELDEESVQLDREIEEELRGR